MTEAGNDPTLCTTIVMVGPDLCSSMEWLPVVTSRKLERSRVMHSYQV